jgi:hypothetical protein
MNAETLLGASAFISFFELSDARAKRCALPEMCTETPRVAGHHRAMLRSRHMPYGLPIRSAAFNRMNPANLR